jgi:hypothetical protein
LLSNGFIERFNRSYREAILDMFVFQSLAEVRQQTEQWLKEYKEERPHESLGHLTPREYLLTQNPKSLVISGPKQGRVTAGESRAERCDRKKALKPAAKRELVAVLQTEHELGRVTISCWRERPGSRAHPN